MKIAVRLFGPLAEAAGTAALTLDLPAPATCRSAAQALLCRLPSLAGRLDPSVRFAVGVEYAPPDRALAHGDTLCLIPPVGGG